MWQTCAPASLTKGLMPKCLAAASMERHEVSLMVQLPLYKNSNSNMIVSTGYLPVPRRSVTGPPHTRLPH